MTTANNKANTRSTTPAAGEKHDETPADETPTETPDEPAVGSVRRLDDPEEGGHPVFGIYCGDGYVVRLPVAAKYELQTYPVE